MKDILKLSVVLTIVTAVAGLALGTVKNFTNSRIEAQRLEEQTQALGRVFPKGVAVAEMVGTSPLPRKYWIGTKDGQLVGYALQGTGKGYSSDIKLIVGVGPQGTILGLTILSQKETPGLGTRTQETMSTRYIWNGLFAEKEAGTPWFTQQFTGLNANKEINIEKEAEWHAMSKEKRKTLQQANNVSALTGATISTRAVTAGVARYVQAYLPALTAQSETTSTMEQQ